MELLVDLMMDHPTSKAQLLTLQLTVCVHAHNLHFDPAVCSSLLALALGPPLWTGDEASSLSLRAYCFLPVGSCLALLFE